MHAFDTFAFLPNFNLLPACQYLAGSISLKKDALSKHLDKNMQYFSGAHGMNEPAGLIILFLCALVVHEDLTSGKIGKQKSHCHSGPSKAA